MSENYIRELRKLHQTLKSCSLMEVDIDDDVVFRINKKDEDWANRKIKDPDWISDKETGKRVLNTDLNIPKDFVDKDEEGEEEKNKPSSKKLDSLKEKESLEKNS